MKSLRYIWLLAAASLLLWGCAKESLVPDDDMAYGQDMELSFKVSESPSATKSAVITHDDDAIKEMLILVYRRGTTTRNNGVLVATRRCGPWGGVVNVEGQYITRSATFSFYAIANANAFADSSIPDRENDLRNWKWSIDSPDDLNGYIPMSWSLQNQTLSTRSEKEFTIEYKRLVSRVDFSLDKSALGAVNITSVRLRQGAADIAPFANSSKATAAIDFDYASVSDLASLNAGGTATFYTLENNRGNLLSGNTDSWAKIPDNISATEAALCTYLEVRAEFGSASIHSGAVTYRLFLGKNSTTNFDLVRNTVNTVKLTLTEDGLNKGIDWKVDTSEMGKGIDWEIDKSSLYIAQKANLSLNNITVTDIHTSDGGNISLDETNGNYVISALSSGVDTVYVSGTDADGEVLAQKIAIEVLAPVLGFDDNDLYLALDGTAKAIEAQYYDIEGNVLNDFDPVLYDALLSIDFDADILSDNVVASIGGGIATCSIRSLYGIETSGRGDIEDKLVLGSVSASAVSDDIAAVTASIYTCDPFPASGKLGSYVSKGLVTFNEGQNLGGVNETITLNFGKIREFTDSTAYHIVLGRSTDIKNDRCLCRAEESAIQATWLYGTNNDLYLPSGSEQFSGYVTNQWSDENWWSPRTWEASFTVHAAIGGNVVFAGGSETNPMCYYVRAVWGHNHEESSPLQAVNDNIVASVEDFHGYYSTGMYTLIYSLDYSTGYPAESNAWYSDNKPEFNIVDVTATNYLNPVVVATPYSLSFSGYNLVVYNYSDIKTDSNNWVL